MSRCLWCGTERQPPFGPLRAFEIVIHAGADTWERLEHELRYLMRHLEEHGAECGSTSGGSDSHHTVHITLSPDMTHERYVTELNAYLDALHNRDVAGPTVERVGEEET